MESNSEDVHGHQEMGKQLEALAGEVKELAKRGGISYDEYIGLVVDRFSGQDSPFIRATVRNILGYEGKASDSNTWNRSNSTVDRLKEINLNYVCLLLDPLICKRSDKFIEFAKRYPTLQAKELREKFISTFPTKTYYRSVVLSKNTPELKNSHLSPMVRTVVEDNGNKIGKYICENIVVANSVKKYAKDGGDYNYLFNLPLLGRFNEETNRHVTNRTTNSDYVSVSELPEMAWYVTCDNGKSLWKQWTRDMKMRMYKFQMNSFYGMSTRDLVWGDHSDEELEKYKYIVQDNNGRLEIPSSDPKIETLIPIALPKNFDHEFKDYYPIWNDFSIVEFPYAKTNDWL